MLYKRGLLFTFIFIISLAATVMGYKFTLHPSFDRSPVKIMDTPECTYFLVHQQMFNKSIPTYDFPTLTIFKQKNGEDRIFPLSQEVTLSGFDIRIADYLPDARMLFIGYADGTIDLVKADGEVVSLHYLSNTGIPGKSVIRSVNEDRASMSFWVTTDRGFIEIKREDLSIRRNCNIGPVTCAFRCGGRILMLKNNCIYECRDSLASPADFVEIGETGGVEKMLYLNENSFACVKQNAGSDAELIKITEAEKGWEVKSLCKDAFISLSPNECVNDIFEGNFTCTSGGYLFNSKDKIWRLSFSGDLDNLQMDRMMNPVGSRDFRVFISYCDRGKFQEREYDGKWEDRGVPIRPEAPAAFLCTHVAFSPSAGTLIINHGVAPHLFNTSCVSPSLLSVWNGKRWSTPNQVYNQPDIPAPMSSYQSIYEKWINRFPVPEPTGLAVDPSDPRCVIISSTFGGVAMMDVTNPGRLPIKFCSPSDPLATFPGSVACMPDQNWTAFSSFSAPMFDADGTVWCSYLNLSGDESNGIGKFQMKYLTAERRRALFEADWQNAASLENWETLTFPYFKATQCYNKGMVFKHPRSRNFVMIDSQTWGRGLAIIDYKGTLEDSSDDEMWLAHGYITPSGSKREFVYAIDMIEHPRTGELIMADFGSLVKFAPPFSVNSDGYLMGESLKLSGADANSLLPESCSVNKLAFDSYGRLWIATAGEGLICVSADGGRIERRFTRENGGLPSNEVYGLGWNPVLNSMMVSTKVGLAEIFPDVVSDMAGDKGVSGEFYVYPSKITPDYNGSLYLRNLPLNTEIRVRNVNGEVVRRLQNGPHRFIGYDLQDSNGDRLSTGVYTVETDESEPVEFLIVT